MEEADPIELEPHRPWLHKLALSILRDPARAEDCVQDVFVAALDRRSARWSDEPSLRAWLRRVLLNRARKLANREALRRFHEVRSLAEHRHGGARDPLELRELRTEVQRALRTLEERYRDIVLLRHQQGLLPSEIARRLGMPVKTVNSRLHRAHGKLRERLDRRFEGLGGFTPLLCRALQDGSASAGTRTDTEADHSRPAPLSRPPSWAGTGPLPGSSASAAAT